MLIIALVLFTIVLLVTLTVLLGSISFRMEASYKGGRVLGKILLRWIAPFVFSLDYDLGKGLITGRILGRAINAANSEDESGDDHSERDSFDRKERVGENIRPGEAETLETESAEHLESEGRDAGGLIASRDSGTSKDEPSFTKEGKKIPEALSGKRIFFLFKDRRWRQKIVNWLKRVLRSLTSLIRFNYLKANIKAGFSDPAHVGVIFGYFTAIRSAMAIQKRTYDLSLEPVFMKNYLEFDCAIAFKTTVWRFCVPVLIAVVFFPYFHTYRLMKKSRDEKKSNKRVNSV